MSAGKIQMQDVLKIAKSMAREDLTHTLSCRLSLPPLFSCTLGQPSSSLTWRTRPCTWHKWWVYGLLCPTYMAKSHCACRKILVSVIWVHFGSYLQTYGARNFKFAGSVVQRSYLVMVALRRKMILCAIWLILPWTVTFDVRFETNLFKSMHTKHSELWK